MDDRLPAPTRKELVWTLAAVGAILAAAQVLLR